MPYSKKSNSHESADQKRPPGVPVAIAKSTGSSNPVVLAGLALFLGVLLLVLVSRIGGLHTQSSSDPSGETSVRHPQQTSQKAVSGHTQETISGHTTRSGAAKNPGAEARGKIPAARTKASGGKSDTASHRDAPSPMRLASLPENDGREGYASADREAGDDETDTSTADSAGQHEPELERNLAISGRVLNEAGDAVSGIEVTATALRFFGVAEGTVISPSDRQKRTFSNGYGSYGFYQLPAGEYAIRTVAQGEYPSAQIRVRAGVDYVDLVLIGAERSLQISGVVAGDQGEPLSRVSVTALIPGAPQGDSTDNDGTYALSLPLRGSTRSFYVRFAREGYRVQQLHLSQNDWAHLDRMEFHVTLEPVEELKELAQVAGSVWNSAGEPVTGEAVTLVSPRRNASHQAVTDEAGEFSFAEVVTASDYQLSVRPSKLYQDYTQRNLPVTGDGLYVAVALERLEAPSRLTGQMVDLYGNPVPHFTLTLRSQEGGNRTWRVTGDDNGYYVVDDVPAGALVFETGSFPKFTVKGIDLAAGGQAYVPLTLDWGRHELYGAVVDGQDNPVAVPEIFLTWSHDAGGVRSWSGRKAAADAAGSFRFTGLGPGRHTIYMVAPGLGSARVDHNIGEQGGETVVRLEETAGQR